MINNKSVHKYETLYLGTFGITQFWTNGMVKLIYGAIKIMCNIRLIRTYTSDTNFEDINIGKYVWQ